MGTHLRYIVIYRRISFIYLWNLRLSWTCFRKSAYYRRNMQYTYFNNSVCRIIQFRNILKYRITYRIKRFSGYLLFITENCISHFSKSWTYFVKSHNNCSPSSNLYWEWRNRCCSNSYIVNSCRSRYKRTSSKSCYSTFQYFKTTWSGFTYSLS